MSDTSIRVSEEAKSRLDLFKREGESYEDVIMRLTERDRWAGFGVLADTDAETRAGMNEMRAQLREGITDDIDE